MNHRFIFFYYPIFTHIFKKPSQFLKLEKVVSKILFWFLDFKNSSVSLKLMKTIIEYLRGTSINFKTKLLPNET